MESLETEELELRCVIVIKTVHVHKLSDEMFYRIEVEITVSSIT